MKRDTANPFRRHPAIVITCDSSAITVQVEPFGEGSTIRAFGESENNEPGESDGDSPRLPANTASTDWANVLADSSLC